MKKFGVALTVLAVVALSVATSQAALVSLYTMDSTGNNAIGSCAEWQHWYRRQL